MLKYNILIPEVNYSLAITLELLTGPSLPTEPRVQSLVTSYEIYGERSGTGTDFFSIVFRFSLLFVIRPLLPTPINVPRGVS
jgi:hypothetical protein